MASEQDKILNEVTGGGYKYGFETLIGTDTLHKELN